MNTPIDALKGAKVLVTGGTGYLATSLISQLMKVDCSIIRLSRFGANFTPMTGKAQLRDVEGDIRTPAVWESVLAGVDIVFHFAAQTSVYAAEENPLADMENNVFPMFHLLETCRKMNMKVNILFAGTTTEAGMPNRLPVDETYPDQPITVYDLHKWVAENYLKYYVRKKLVQGAVLRVANVYGPGVKNSNPDRGVLNMMIRKAVNGETITIYGKGNYVRDYIYIDDLVGAFLHGAANIEQINGQHFVIGSGEACTLADAFNLVADRAALKTGKRAIVTHIEAPASLSPIEFRNFVADTKQFSEYTGWRPTCLLSAGIDRTVESYLIK